MKVLIIGGVAAGPKAASKIIRLLPDTEVTLLEKGEVLSYAGCGLPYYVSGLVKDSHELMSTPIGVVRDPVFFGKVKNVHVFNRTEATAIDRKARIVTARLPDGSIHQYPYDKLVLATGASPAVPPFSGIELKNIFTLQKVEDAERIKEKLSEGKALDVVIVGAGLIGMEMAETFVHHGCRVTMIEKLPQILPMLDEDMAAVVHNYLEQKGVKVRTGVGVTGFSGTESVSFVKTDAGEFSADLVLISVGVRPNSRLAKEAGIETGITGGIRVDEKMQTSDPDVYAVGDCAEQTHLITNKPCFVPLGSTANKQGRVAAMNICGRKDGFPGVLGSAVCKIFDYAVGRTGLTEKQAKAEGFDVVCTLFPAPDRAHYYPDAKNLYLKAVADRNSRRLLGVQAVGPGVADKRIDAAAVVLTAQMTVDQVANLDLCYAPPFASAMDNLITAANVLRNILDGDYRSYSVREVKDKIEKGEDIVLLDVRSPKELEWRKIEGAVHIPLGMLREKCCSALPFDKEIIAFCKVSLRGYEAALILKSHGYSRVAVMDGGVLAWVDTVVSR